MSCKSETIGELCYLESMEKCKEGSALANYVFLFSGVEIFYLGQDVMALHFVHFQ